MPEPKKATKDARRSTGEKVRLKPADPFDLIRLIARTQSDPRKAVAELVQNSMDAGARSIHITRFTHKGSRSLSVYDDGHGVFPEFERQEALKRIVTTIGHSYKAHMTAAERHQQMTLGKYGIGLLGFWSVGRVMEIRSRVRGSDPWVLRLEEEVRDGEVTRSRSSRLHGKETFTEVVISEIHPAAESQLQMRRLAAYLAGEMRGQLLQRDVKLELFDHVARGLAQKHLLVKPQRFQGIPVDVPRELPVDGFAPALVELYLVGQEEGRRAAVTLACGGSTVLDDMGTIDGFDAPREPWCSSRFEGVIDFPDLAVAPGTRRGFVPNAASSALLRALPELEALCRGVLEQDAERRRQEREADDAKDLRKVFRRLPIALPHYALFSVKNPRAIEPAEFEDGSHVGERDADQRSEVAEALSSEIDGDQSYLFPIGPLASAELRPKKSVLAPGDERRLRAIARDGDGREVKEGIEHQWILEGQGALEVDPSNRSATYQAPANPCEPRVQVRITQNDRHAEAFAELRVSDEAKSDGDAGVPDPQPVSAPSESWRSRVLGKVWQYNTAHPDYRSVQDDLRRRLRYLVHLFAKEVVLRNFGDVTQGPILERMVEVLTHVGDSVARRAP